MSCAWDLHCVDCDVDLGVDLNHGADRCCALWLLRDDLALVGEVARRLRSEVPGWFDEVGQIGDRGRLEWFADHRGHRIVVRDEYGHVLGKCERYVRCPTCASTHSKCALEFGHEGPCVAGRHP